MKLNPMKDMVRTFRAAVPAFKNGKRFASKLRAPARAAKDPAQEEMPCGELYLYDAIGADYFGGISSKDVVSAIQDLEKSGAKTLNIFINSPGGDVFEGTAIYTAISRFSGKKCVYIDSLAASAASYVAMAGDEIYTAFNAMWMIHNPWGLVIGNANDMRKTADDLEKIGTTLVDTYARRTGCSAKDIQAWMNEETWFTAAEAKKNGFSNFTVNDKGDVEPDPEDPEEDEEDPEEEQMSAASASILAKFKNTPNDRRPKSRDMLKSMEQRVMNLRRASPSKK
jgi:ATP-dependent Clp protease protease subunit